MGPVSFLVYISSLYDIISYYLLSVAGQANANDIQLYISFQPNSDFSEAEAVSEIEDCISNIRDYMLHFNLKLNYAKTEVFLIGTSNS